MTVLLMTWHCLVFDFWKVWHCLVSGLSWPPCSNKTNSLLQFYVPLGFVISKIVMQLMQNVTPNIL